MTLTMVNFRAPEPPHGTLLTVFPSALRYAFKVRAAATGSFMLARSDPSVALIVALLLAGRPPMVTFETDGYLPFVGFVVTFDAPRGDPNAMFTAADHTWRLAGARTDIAAASRVSSATLIGSVLRDLQTRATPPFAVDLSLVDNGPGVSYEVRAEQGDSFLRSIEGLTNWEAFLTHDVTPGEVKTYLNWSKRQGFDRRSESIWQEGRELAKAGYHLDFSKGAREAFVVGGTGAYTARPTARAIGAAPIGLGGSKTLTLQQTTDATALQTQAAQMLDAPDNAAESFDLAVVSSNIDRSRYGVGDLRTIRLPAAFLNTPIERDVRIVGLEIDPVSGVDSVQVVTWQ